MGILFSMPGNERLAAELARATSWSRGALETRRFPDGESYVRILSAVAGHRTAILCTLAQPDNLFLRLVFTARTLRDLGARTVTLIAPYLAYLRQDSLFEPGEALTSRYFAALLSKEFDRLITVDPHLHRYASLQAVYSIHTTVVHSAPMLAGWVKENIDRPIIVGPDAESLQWVSTIARMANAPCLVLEKERIGDRSVKLKAPDLTRWKQCHPVIVDDIASSGVTLVEAMKCLRAQGLPAPACLVVHALLGARAERDLAAAASILLSTNAVPHRTNGITIAPAIAEALDR